MTAERTRGTRKFGGGHTTLTCDFRQSNGDGCLNSTPRKGDSAAAVRKVAREMGWVRVEGKDFCPAHVCPHGYVPGDHHYDSGSCARRTPESDARD